MPQVLNSTTAPSVTLGAEALAAAVDYTFSCLATSSLDFQQAAARFVVSKDRFPLPTVVLVRVLVWALFVAVASRLRAWCLRACVLAGQPNGPVLNVQADQSNVVVGLSVT